MTMVPRHASGVFTEKPAGLSQSCSSLRSFGRDSRHKKRLGTSTHVKAVLQDVEPRNDGAVINQLDLVNLMQGTQQEVFETDEAFVWRENWYPVALGKNLEKTKPNKIILLNEGIVIWWGRDSRWHAAVDRCPHRLAPLSEGRMDNGVLECRYHGWQFAESGECSFSPQSANKPTSCLQTYPCKEASSLIWIWPESGPIAAEKAERKELPLYPEAKNDSMFGLGDEFFENIQPVHIYLSVENFLDPSHAPCLHEGALGCGSRKQIAPLSMEVSSIGRTEGVHVQHDGYTSLQKAMQMQGHREFRPPFITRSIHTFNNGAKVQALIYHTPKTPNSTRCFGKFIHEGGPAPQWTNTEKGLPLKDSLLKIVTGLVRKAKASCYQALGFTPVVQFHASAAPFTDQDALLLKKSAKYMARDTLCKDTEKGMRPSQLSSKNYNLLSAADRGVIALWRWIDRWGGEPDWSTQEGHFNVEFSTTDRKSLFSHFSRHTMHCAQCMKAVNRMDKAVRWIGLATVILPVIAATLVQSVVLRCALVIAAGSLHWCKVHVKHLRLLLNGTSTLLLPDEKEAPLGM